MTGHWLTVDTLIILLKPWKRQRKKLKLQRKQKTAVTLLKRPRRNNICHRIHLLLIKNTINLSWYHSIPFSLVNKYYSFFSHDDYIFFRTDDSPSHIFLAFS